MPENKNINLLEKLNVPCLIRLRDGSSAYLFSWDVLHKNSPSSFYRETINRLKSENGIEWPKIANQSLQLFGLIEIFSADEINSFIDLIQYMAISGKKGKVFIGIFNADYTHLFLIPPDTNNKTLIIKNDYIPMEISQEENKSEFPWIKGDSDRECAKDKYIISDNLTEIFEYLTFFKKEVGWMPNALFLYSKIALIDVGNFFEKLYRNGKPYHFLLGKCFQDSMPRSYFKFLAFLCDITPDPTYNPKVSSDERYLKSIRFLDYCDDYVLPGWMKAMGLDVSKTFRAHLEELKDQFNRQKSYLSPKWNVVPRQKIQEIYNRITNSQA